MIHFSKPHITKKTLNKINKQFLTGNITLGEQVNKFEKLNAKILQSKYTIATNSCSSALLISLKYLNLQKNDEVITTPLTFVSTVHSIILSNAKPVLCDVNDDGNLGLNEIKKKITKKTKALLIVNFGGNPCNVEEIYKFCKKKNIFLIQDCAHSFGSYYKNKSLSKYSDVSCYSFYPTKNITTIEGGMIVTNNIKLYKFSKLFINNGIDKNYSQRKSNKKFWDYDVVSLGQKMHMTNIQAILGMEQIRKFSQMQQKRKIIFFKYKNKIKNNKLNFLFNENKDKELSYHLAIIQTKLPKNRDKLLQYLKKFNIYCSVHYKPIYKFNFFKKNFSFNKKFFRNCEYFTKRCISLPIFPDLSKSEQDIIIEKINQF